MRFFGQADWSPHTDLATYARDLPPDVFASYFKFAVVRNPWDRLVSDYFCQRRKRSRKSTQLFTRDDNGRRRPFSEWLEIALADPHRYQPSQWGANVSSTVHRWSPQTDWLRLEGKIAVDKVLRFEDLRAEILELRRTLDLPAGELPCRRWTWHSHYSCYYNESTRRRVESYYGDDIDAFGYRFESRKGNLSSLLPERFPMRSRDVLNRLVPVARRIR